ncbi:MAG: hypothetical protein ACRDKG_09600 [Actinomycetota bacterium]
MMFGDETGVIAAIRAFDLHGVTYYDLAVRFDDGRMEDARLGAESVAGGLEPGDRVRVMRAGLMIIQVAREQA